MKPYDFPDAQGHFGPYGGVFVAETLMHALDELRAAYDRYRVDPAFLEEFNAPVNRHQRAQHVDVRLNARLG